MSLTSPLPARTRRIIAAARWRICVQCGFHGVEYHHAVTWAGKRVGHHLALLPLCRSCHRNPAKMGTLDDPRFCVNATALLLHAIGVPNEPWVAKVMERADTLELYPEQMARIRAYGQALEAAAKKIAPTP